MSTETANAVHTGTSTPPATPSVSAEINASLDTFISGLAADQETARESAATEYLKKYEAEDQGKPVEEANVPEGQVEPEVLTSEAEDAGMARLASREAKLRESEQSFEQKVAAAVQAKLPDFRGKSTDDILKHFGVDPDLAFKQMMYDRASDTNPVKARLREELRDHATKKELDQLKKQIEDRDRQAAESTAAAQYFDNYSAGLRKHVTEKVDEKVAPNVALAFKAKPDYVHSRLLKEVTRDAQEKLARGAPDGKELTFEEAVKALEEDWSVLAEAIASKTTATKPVNSSAKSPVASRPVVKPVPPAANPFDESEIDRQIQIAVARSTLGRVA